MNVIFFKKNIAFVLEQFSTNNNICAFWYDQGLSSYMNLDTVLSIEDIYIEKTIYEDFSRTNSLLLKSCRKVNVFESSDYKLDANNMVCFFASNDTHIYLFHNILLNRAKNWSLFTRKGESAKKFASNLNLEATDINLSIPNIVSNKVLVMGNDWGPLEQKVNLEFQDAGINTLCIQESVIDFNQRDKRMQYCSIPIFQGIVTLKNVKLSGRICAVIGNPRYEKLQETPLPSTRSVFVNVNFTYGIFEDIRDKWVNDVVESCNQLGIDYSICQHPRDRGDFRHLNLIKTNASSVHSALSDSGILVTRFSSLIHEALCLGRPVIYYNPHGEKLFYDFEPDNKCLFIIDNKDDLVAALKYLKEDFVQLTLSNSIQTYLDRHLGITRYEKASHFINKFIDDVSNYPPVKQVTWQELLLSKLKRLKRIIFAQKM